MGVSSSGCERGGTPGAAASQLGAGLTCVWPGEVCVACVTYMCLAALVIYELPVLSKCVWDVTVCLW